MITARLFLESGGTLAGCTVSGHADYAGKGSDVVCAAVTFAVRTTGDVLAQTEGVILEFVIPCRGELAFWIRSFENRNREKLTYAAEFLEKGLRFVADEYPANVSVEIIDK